MITYTGLEPINAGNSANTILNFLTGESNNATLRNNVLLSGSIEIIDNGLSFEDTVIPNPTNSLTVNLGDQGNALTVNTLDAAYAASLIINGGTGVDDVIIDTVTLANTPGRGLDVAGVEMLVITGSTFSNNSADVGAGLRVIGGTTNIDTSTFSGNVAIGDASTQGGGAIFADGVMTIRDGTIIDDNSASGIAGSGGGILVGPSGMLTVIDSEITDNTANRAGGGIEIQSGNDLTLTNVTLQGNNAGVFPAIAAPGNGGGLHVTGDANVGIVGGIIRSNRAAAEGGGLWNDQGTMTISGGTLIELNVAAGDLDPSGMATDLQGGGGIFNNGGTLTINDNAAAVVVQNNQASGGTFGSGGGILSIGGAVNITAAMIMSNEAVRAGGGVEVVEGSVAITDSELSGNDVSADDLLGAALLANPGNGGGLHITGAANVTISGGSITGNIAEAEGGGLWNSATGSLTISGLVNGVSITGNIARGDAAPGADGSAVQGGGGLFNNGGTLILDGDRTLRNIVISANAASGANNGSGGGVLSTGGDISLNGATIDGNEAVRAGGGVEIVDGSVAILQTNIRNNDVSADDLLGLGLGTSAGNGGGLHITGSAGVGYDGGTLSGNIAESEGGGLWNSATGTLRIEDGQGDTLISGNIARGDADPAGNAADVQGGGGIFNNGGTLLFNDVVPVNTVTVTDNAASGANFGSGGGILSVGGTVDIVDALIVRNEAVRAGGGIEAVSGTVTLFQVELSNNDVSDADLLGLGLAASPGNGGGLHITADAIARLDTVVVSANDAQAEGGGLWNSATGTLILDGVSNLGDVTVSNNIARGDASPGVGGVAVQGGGGIFNNGGMLNLLGSSARNVVIENNAATGAINGSGGGILSIDGNVTIDNSIINANEAVRAGGGIELVDGTVMIAGTEITGNDVSLDDLLGFDLGANPGNGGGLHVTGMANVTVDGGTVSGNVAQREGGGLWNSLGTMTIQGGAVIDGNVASGPAADDGGGGIFNNGGTLVITGATTTISNNAADGTSGSGGGIFNNLGGTVSMTDATISGNVANRAGGGIEDASGSGFGVMITGGSLVGNNAGVAPAIASPGNGGGLHVTGASDVTIDGTLVQGNSAALEGGGLWNGSGTMTVQNGAVIENNLASGDAIDDGGGGIFNNGGTLVISGATTLVHNNQANGLSGSGGGIFSGSSGSVSITDATIEANTASIDGGGLFAQGISGAVTLRGALFDSNLAGDSGGGVYVDSSATTIDSSSFNSNQAQGLTGLDGDGGGLFLRGDVGSSFNVTDTSFDLNRAVGGGGGAFFVDIDGAISGGSYTSNQVTGNGTTFDTGGGGITIVGETIVPVVNISGVTVDGNTAPSAAGIGIVDSLVTVGTSIIANNIATEVLSGGGGIGALATTSIGGDVLALSLTRITGNTTAGEGGGIGIINGDVSIADTTIDGNQANGGRGGGIGLLNNGIAGTATIRSTTISANTASVNGGGIAALNMGIDLENVTLSGNNSDASGGGISYDNNVDNVTRSIRFSTITSNTSLAGGSNLSATGSPIDVSGTIFNDGVVAAPPGVLNSLGNNLDSGSTAGFSEPTDLVNTDPMIGPLQDNGGPVFTHALLGSSPAIDAGPATGPATDAHGFLRPVDGDGNGSVLFDIGAFEAESAAALFVDDVMVDEDAGTATITVRMPAPVTGGFTVDFATADGTANQPGDYTATSGTLTFVGNANEIQTFTVPIIDDDIVESDETVLISLSNPSNTMIDVTDTGVLTILDNDFATLTVNDVTVDEGVGLATVVVTIDNAVQDGFTVDFATSDGTAIAPDDYIATSGMLTFVGMVGEMQSFTVPIVDDMVPEPTETINISLSNPSVDAIDASDTAVINIIDNDAPSLTIGDVTVDEAAGTATVSVGLNIAVASGFTADFTTTNATATAGEDYTATSGTLSFAGIAGEIQTFTVPITDDMIVEATETFVTSISSVSDTSVIITDTGLVSILDNDMAALMVSDVSVEESAGSAVVTISVSNPVQGGFTVDFATMDGTAMQPGDYTMTSGTLMFAGTAGETRSITIPIISDAVSEPTKQFTVGLSNVVPLGMNPAPATSIDATDTGTVTITESATQVDLGTTIMDSVDPVLVGGMTVYTVTVTNLGSTAASSVVSTTTVPAGLSVTSASSPTGMVTVVGGVVTGNFSSIGVGMSATITINATAGTTPGTVTVDTSVSAAETDSDPTNNTASETTTINPSDPSLVSGRVFCDANNNGQDDMGEEVSGTVVFLDLNNNARFDSGEPSTTTDSTGSYQFNGVMPADVSVSVVVPLSCNTITDEPGVRRSIVEVGQLARSIASADVNLDGRPDLLVASDLSNSLAVVTNNGDTFTADIRTLPGAASRPQSVFAYQPDLLQSPTIAVAGIGSPSDGGAVFTMVGQGAITRTGGSSGPIDVLVDDFNGDMIPDVLSASFRDSILQLRLGGASEPLTIEVLPQQILSIASGNLVGDEQTREVVVSGFGYAQATQLELLEINSSGVARRLDSIETAPTIVEVAVESILDNAGQLSTNQIVALYSSGKIVVYPMVGGRIGQGIETDVIPGASSFDFGDFNNDGMSDVAIANLGGQFIELYSGAGDGRFALVTTVRNVSAPSDVVVDDFDGDGFDDIAVANFYTDANIANSTLPPAFSLPSTATILQLEIASRPVTITSSSTVADFRFPSADPEIILDTSRDNRITALDALRVINVLDRQAAAEGEQVAGSRAATDVNGDGRTSAVDALMVINYLQRDANAPGGQLAIDDLIPSDDDGDRDEVIAAFDLALTQGVE